MRVSKDGHKAIYIDLDNKKEILAYIKQDERHIKKFNFFVDIFLENLRNSKIYTKENISDKCQDIYAVKLFIGQENDRIYCKETNDKDGIRITILGILHKTKKTETLSSKEISIIEKLANYEYEFEQTN